MLLNWLTFSRNILEIWNRVKSPIQFHPRPRDGILWIIDNINTLTIAMQRAKNNHGILNELNKSTNQPNKVGPNTMPKLATKKEKPIPIPVPLFNEISPISVNQTAFHPIPVRPNRIEMK